ncbi:MAG: helix-turn-helix transcriptional regulator [Candidatus Cloacimonadaceae bacterium]|jgi:transcriptional regulator with XRE-family HTH domain|uniref:Transcriptional regulator with XRE-family HTH domain n=1 Tax=Alkalibaculum bacchi TaxID=645887 RepID=A0A366I2C6_9FIRM|nr:helix-turn-helix transcriptional regulator [Alkalibaculum bacchi]RBP60378.1 transcriptional regulator with XRE-family HTH domain [Alkalibaculum bacchi]
MNFAQQLKDLRKEKNLTQEELAKKTGISLRTISRYELGDTLPRTKKYYEKIAEALDVDADYFLSQEANFLINARNEFGYKGAKDAEELVNEMIGLMAGGELPDEDKATILDAMQEAFYMAKLENKKYTPKKYRIEEE